MSCNAVPGDLGITPKEDLQGLFDALLEWLSPGETWIGIFENQDLGHASVGKRVGLAFDDRLWDEGIIGKTSAPDNKEYGIGWRWTLQHKTRCAGEALCWLLHKEKEVTNGSTED
jgi:hypothetical protein